MKPLAGVRVVELANWIAAPAAGAVLADLGADVIKVEPPGGDPVRGFLRPAQVSGPAAEVDYPFTVSNRGKRSVELAINVEAGRAALLELVSSADVFLTNMLAYRLSRYGLEASNLQAVNPRLVVAQVSGYGSRGPDAHRPGYDITAFFARGGMIHTMTPPDGDAPKPPTGPGDHATGMALVAAILLGLRAVDKTGQGQVVDTSLLSMGIWTMGTMLAATLVDGRDSGRRSRSTEITALNNRYRTADDRWLYLTMPGGEKWPKLCEVLGVEDMVTDERFRDARARYRNMGLVVERLDKAFASKTRAEWGRILDDAGLVWGPVYSLTEVVADPQADALGLFPEIEHPTAGRFRTVGIPFEMEGADIGPSGPAPSVGEHSEEVFRELGWDETRLEEARLSGAFGRP
ncbi:MAG: CoA transferase [bacterium]|nr:CoA transferase [bacterium]MCY3651525.1 CoA transferase [bacterium]MDE0642599.1 CoA transferase [bacterium]